MWLCALADAAAPGAGCGGKAAALARLIAAGLPVPDGFALAGAAFRAVVGAIAIGADAAEAGHALAEAARRIDEAAPDAEVVARAAGLGVLAVRSSATIEDGEAGAAAGVFSSRRAVPAAEVWDAVRAVWTSALTPLAVAYARRRGDASGVATIGVIVQRFVPGERVTVYTRTPAGSDEVWVQRGAALARHTRADADRIVQLALAAEGAIGATVTGADVELVDGRAGDGDGDVWIVQARPIVRAPAVPLRAPPPPIVLAGLADGRRWTWDVAHNPDPLSPAQAGLVARVAAAGVAPWALRVCAGYLYFASLAPGAGPVVVRDAADLAARAGVLEAAMEHALGDGDAASLDDALARYVAFYAPWAALAALISAARRVLPDALHARGDARAEASAAAWSHARPSAVEATLLAAARGELAEADAIARLAPLAPAWDVAVPTFGEQPALVRDAIARARSSPATSPAVPPPSPAELADAIALAAAAADLAERDDFAFARAQRLVRRALLARARDLAIARDDVFWLPLDEVAAATALDRDTAHRRAGAARAAAARAAHWDMPIVVGGAAPPVVAGARLHGVGHGARVTGRVVRFASLASAVVVSHGDIVVARAVTPALAVLVAGCAAIVSETGGLLDHGAALARELGVPCVVGCQGAWSALGDGDVVRVDGDAGTVEPC